MRTTALGIHQLLENGDLVLGGSAPCLARLERKARIATAPRLCEINRGRRVCGRDCHIRDLTVSPVGTPSEKVSLPIGVSIRRALSNPFSAWTAEMPSSSAEFARVQRRRLIHLPQQD